jgi:quercetin dioxygenase-like cupin family protein
MIRPVAAIDLPGTPAAVARPSVRQRPPSAVPLGVRGDIHRVDAAALDWYETPEPGLRLKPVRYDDELGLFLGLVHFAPMARSGLHQHQDVATSFVVDGSLTDYHGSIGLHQVGINLQGATHDAMAYQNTVLVSRLQGPVTYPHERSELTGLHAGSRHSVIVNPAPEMPPEVNVAIDEVAAMQTGVPGLTRQLGFDYAGTRHNHRFSQLRMAPGTECPPWRATGLVELWVRGGLVEINGVVSHANTFVSIEPGAELHWRSPYGALLLVWAEGPEQWLGVAPGQGLRTFRPSLFGF